MTRNIQSVGVIGAGTMGAGIAALCANSGLPVTLLDLDKDMAVNSIERLKGGRKPVLGDEQAALITCGSIADDLDSLSNCDWICEVIVENLEAKRTLFAKVEAVRKDGSIVTSNTSGIPLRDICEGMPERFQRDVAVTHFFNPVHIMRLLELVPGEKTDPAVLQALSDLLGKQLGKGIVNAKDTVNFIGNRIGCFWILAGLHKGLEAQQKGLDMETIDALLSRPIGLPPTGLYGLVDLIGLDIMLNVANNLKANLPTADAGHAYTTLPGVEQAMLEAGQLGRKTGGGYYKINRHEDGSKSMEVFDLTSQSWRDARTAELSDGQQQLESLAFNDDQSGAFVWSLMSETLCYAADLVPEIADDIVNIDRAMRWGFNWAQGPFELIDRIGARQFIEKLTAEGREIPRMLAVLQNAGADTFYQNDQYLSVDGQWVAMPPE